MTKPTEGPYRYMGFGGIGALGTTDTYAGPVWSVIAQCKDTTHTDSEGRTWTCDGDKEANARLLAKSWEMREMLRKIDSDWDGEPEDMFEVRALLASIDGDSQ